MVKTSFTPTQTDLNIVSVEALDRDGTVVWSTGYFFEVKTG